MIIPIAAFQINSTSAVAGSLSNIGIATETTNTATAIPAKTPAIRERCLSLSAICQEYHETRSYHSGRPDAMERGGLERMEGLAADQAFDARFSITLD